ncbi:MAG TPA: NAD(P)/FAD-dependent oxidoreductase [Solirubrobacteraceae bacterium]
MHARVVIVGGGFSGLGMAIGLKRHGVEDFVVLERAPDVGGAWHHNSYPGCTCDIPSHLYSFSFAPNPNWSHTYSPRDEIRDYLRRCASEFGIRPHLRTGVELLTATWREADQRWELDTSRGRYSADVLVSATGPLTEPKLPDVPGLDRFEGTAMHSAQWDHDYDLRGKRVASIGTGASAIQYVPEIARDVARLYVMQRTAPWVMPHGNRPIAERERALYRRAPIAQRAVRAGVYASRELLVLGFAKQPRLMGALERLARSHMATQISDPALLAQVTPDYTIGCKRIVPSNRWYRALAADNVQLVTGGLVRVGAHSVVGGDGVERDVDAIIFGTGFHVTDPPIADVMHGRDGRRLADIWAGSPRAYLGTALPGFPNFFMLLGPNTGLGHGSMVYMIESQIEHVRRAVAHLDATGAATLEVSAQAHASFNADVDARLRGTVWDTGGCASFYIDATGRNATLWPDWTWRFRRRCARFDRDAYALTAPRPALVGA